MTTLQTAREAGEQAAALCLDRARRADPEFVAKATAAILAHLQIVGHASGEDLVDVAIAYGARPADARAFGGIFQKLSRQKLITCLRSDLPRRRGHSTSGGKLWAIVSDHSFDAPPKTGM
jgi:hypothetical protein